MPSDHPAFSVVMLRLPILWLAVCCPSLLFGWGQPHHAITRAALQVLPSWQKEWLGEELKSLGDAYCMIPDNVYSDKANAKYAAMDSRRGEIYLQVLHLPTVQTEYLEVMTYFMEQAVTALRDGRRSDAARFMGTMCHQIEDYGSPSHTMPGDNQFTLLQQFLPPSEIMQDKLMHGPIENGDFTVNITGYQPQMLGTSVNEAAWRLMHRVHEGILNARSTTIPILQALYADDTEAVMQQQMRAAVVDSQIVADAMHTILCLGTKQVPKIPTVVPIDTFWPLEAEKLHYPQTQFFSSPYWGHPRVGAILAGGTKKVALKLNLNSGEKEFTKGISAGMGKTLTFVLPKGVFRHFTVFAGLHPELGAKGRVEFAIQGDGRLLSSVTLNGTDAAQKLACEIGGVSQLELMLTSRGLDSKSNYAIWAEPELMK
jgi:hypothetical protein